MGDILSLIGLRKTVKVASQSKPKRPIVGVVCHRFDDTDIKMLQEMEVKHVRLSIYESGLGYDDVATAVNEGFDVVAVTYRNDKYFASDKQTLPEVKWQRGNEPDSVALAAEWVVKDTALGDVSCGLAHGTSRRWMASFAQGLPPTMPLALHCYGLPLVDAILPTLTDGIVTKDGRPLWFTEIGDKAMKTTLAESLRIFDNTPIERVYVYALWSPNDGYTLTNAQRWIIKDYIAGVP